MPYNFVADSFHTKKFCRLSLRTSSEVRFLRENQPFCILSHPLGS